MSATKTAKLVRRRTGIVLVQQNHKYIVTCSFAGVHHSSSQLSHPLAGT